MEINKKSTFADIRSYCETLIDEGIASGDKARDAVVASFVCADKIDFLRGLVKSLDMFKKILREKAAAHLEAHPTLFDKAPYQDKDGLTVAEIKVDDTRYRLVTSAGDFVRIDGSNLTKDFYEGLSAKYKTPRYELNKKALRALDADALTELGLAPREKKDWTRVAEATGEEAAD